MRRPTGRSKIANAEGEAERFLKLLTEYERAPGVTRERLYLETIERVLKSSRKVMLDTKAAAAISCTCRSTSCWSRAGACRASEPEATRDDRGHDTRRRERRHVERRPRGTR